MVAQEAFLSMMTILDLVHQASYRHAFLESYVTFAFQYDPEYEKPLFQQLLSIWVGLIGQNVTFISCDLIG